MLAFKIVHRRGADRTPHCLREINDGKLRWFCLAYFAPSRCRDQLPKRPVMQSHGITLAFHREMADASRELVGPDVTAAVSFESYPRFIKGGSRITRVSGSKDPLPIRSMFPSPRSRLLGNNVFPSVRANGASSGGRLLGARRSCWCPDRACRSNSPHAASDRLRKDSATPCIEVFATSFAPCIMLCPSSLV
jgi:hypothetical protein